MSRPLDEGTLRDNDVSFERVAAAGRRRQTRVATSAAAAVVVAMGAVTFGLSGLNAAGAGTGMGVGYGPPASPTTPWPLETAPSATVHGTPLPSGSSWTPMSAPPRPTGKPTSPAGYCPVQVPSGGGYLINYPMILDKMLDQVPAESGSAGEQRVPFPANRVIICRYPVQGRPKLIGAADVTEPATVAPLLAAFNAATEIRTESTCEIDSNAFIMFLNAEHGRMFNVDLTDCDAWLQPDSVSVRDGFAQGLRELTPAGAGTNKHR